MQKEQKQQELKRLITPKELQEYLKCGKNTTYRLLKYTNIPKVKIGKRYYIPVEELNEWWEKNIGAEISLR